MSGSKVKGILKGLRYISQIFDNGKEQEIQIGYPTDVKHVAHIGWDGPSVNSPSWMNEFKTSPGFASAPLTLTGDVQNREQNNGVKWVSEDSTSSRRSSKQGRDLPELPKASRRPSTGSITDSPTKEKSDRPRQSRRSSRPKDPSSPSDGSRPIRQLISNDSLQGDEGSPARVPPDIPKRSRRKKSKDSSGGGSSKLRSKAQSSDPNLDFESPSGSTTRSRTKQRPFDDNNGYYERGAS